MFKNVWNWLTGIFKDLAKLLEKPAAIAVQVVNTIKQYVYNPAVDLITLMTRADIDDKVIAIVRGYLPSILGGMLRAEGIIKDMANGSLESLLRLFSDYMNKITAEGRGKWWTELAALLLQVISGKPVDKPAAVAMTQALYLKAA